MQGEAAPGVPEKLTETANRLVKIFRLSWRNSHTRLTVALSPAVPEESAEVQLRSDGLFLMLNGSPDLRRSAAWRRKFYSALLLSAAGVPPRSGESRALPAWLPPALDRILAARRAEERLLVGNRRSPVLAALLENDRLPPAATVRAVDPGRFDPAATAWAEELSRALFVAGGRKLGSPEYLRGCDRAARRGGDPDAKWLPEYKKLERNFRRAARMLAWHELSPRPARWTRKKFSELRRLKLPALDAEGKPTGRFDEFDVLELPERLRGRPDAKLRCAEFYRRFFEFSSGDSRPAKLALFGFADLVGYSVDPPFRHEARMRRQLELVDAVLTRQEKLDDYMRRQDLRFAPVRRAYRTRLEYIESFDAASSLLTGAARKWVDEREAEFR